MLTMLMSAIQPPFSVYDMICFFTYFPVRIRTKVHLELAELLKFVVKKVYLLKRHSYRKRRRDSEE